MAPTRTKNMADKMAENLISHRVNVQRFGESVRPKVLSHLRLLSEDLNDKIRRFDLAGVSRESTRYRRTEALIKQTRETIGTSYGDARTTLKEELLELADLEASALPNILNKAIGGSVFTTSITRKDLKALVNDQVVLGGPAKEWWSKQATDLGFRFAQQMRMGVTQGETNDDLVRRIRGTATGKWIETTVDGKTRKLREFSGGVMDLSTREASNLVRTSVQNISNEVLDETYRENQDVLRGEQWLATLDMRTCPQCFPLDKASWDFEGEPLPDSPVKIPFPGRPPIHFSCRCLLSPLTKSWEQLIEETTGKKMKVLEALPPSARASMDGEVSGGMSYNDWLKGKSEAQQKEVLGVGKWELWQKGAVTPNQMLDQSGNPLTLEQLKDRTPSEPAGAPLYRRPTKTEIDSELEELEKQKGSFFNTDDALPPIPPLPVIVPPAKTTQRIQETTAPRRAAVIQATAIVPAEPIQPVSKVDAPSFGKGMAATADIEKVSTAMGRATPLEAYPTVKKAVEVSDLISTKPLVEIQRLKQEIDDLVTAKPKWSSVAVKDTLSSKVPTIARQGGEYYVIDGHDSIMTRRLVDEKFGKAAEKTIQANVVDLDAALEKTGKGIGVSFESELQQLRGVSVDVARVNARMAAPSITPEAMSAAQDDLVDLKGKETLMWERINQKIRRSLAVAEPVQVKVLPSEVLPNGVHMRAADQQEAFDFASSIVSRHAVDATSFEVRAVFESIKGGRSSAIQRGVKYEGLGTFDTHQVRMAKAKKSTMVHELGHIIEYEYPQIQKSAQAFYDRRTAGQPLRRLMDVTGVDGYHDSEMTREDRFIEPYMGKVDNVDNQRPRELVSMGMEMLYQDPARMMMKDPDYFEWIVDTFRGFSTRAHP